MSNEVYEFLLSLSAAQYRAGLTEAATATTKFKTSVTGNLTLVKKAFENTNKAVSQFHTDYVGTLKKSDLATQHYALEIAKSTALMDAAYGKFGRDIEQKIIGMTTKMQGFSGAVSHFNTETAGELRGLSTKMIAASNDTDAYTNSLKSMSASARNATAALKTLNTQSTAAGVSGSASVGAGLAAGAAAGRGRSAPSSIVPSSEIDKANAALKEYKKNLNEATQGSQALATSAFTALTAIGVAVALPAKAFGDYEAVVNRFKSVTMDAGKSAAAAAAEMKKFRDVSFALGTTTQFSAKSVALAAVELGKLGYSASQAIAVLPGILSTATAGQVDLAKAAEYVTAALNGFQLIASKNADVMKESTHVADLFAKAAAMSAVDFSDLGETFKYVSSLAYSSKQSIEDMTAIIGIMGQNMIKGSQAGTSLRQALLSLQRPTKAAREVFDILKINPLQGNGDLKRLPLFLREMRDSLQGVETATKNAAVSAVFGREALSGMLAVMNSSDENFYKFLDGMQDVDGAAKDMANIAFQGLNAEFKKLQATAETAGIKIGEAMSPELIKLAKDLKDFVKAVDSMPQSMKSAIGSTLIFMGKLALLIGTLAGGRALFGFLTGAVMKFVGAQTLAKLGALAAKIAFEAQFAQMVLMENGFKGLSLSASTFGSTVVGAAGAAKVALIGLLPQIAIVAAALAAAMATVESIKNTLQEAKTNEEIDASLTETIKKKEEATKAYNNLSNKIKKNPGKSIQNLLTEGRLSTEELLSGTAGLTNVANSNPNAEVKKALLMTAESWRNMASNFKNQKANYDTLLADQEAYLAMIKEVESSEFQADTTKLRADIAKQKPLLQKRIAELKSHGFNLVDLAYLEQRQKEIDAKITGPLREATRKGKDGDSAEDKVLKALQKKLELQTRQNDAALKGIDIERTQIALQIDHTDALDGYHKKLENGEKFKLTDNAPGIQTAPYGQWRTNSKGQRYQHTGTDFGATMGQTIKSQTAGTVAFKGWYGGYGNTVVVDDGNGHYILYAHNSKVTKEIGAQVKKGEKIAEAGSTGHSTGPHSHQEVRIGKSGIKGKNGEFQLFESGTKLTDPTGTFEGGLHTDIDPVKLEEKNKKIQQMIKNLQSLKAEFLAGGYVNEAAQVDQQIAALQDKISDGNKKFTEELAEQEEQRIKKIQENEKTLLTEIADFHKDLTNANADMAKELAQSTMTEMEKSLDDASRGILTVEGKIAEIKKKIEDADVTEPFREKAIHDIEHFNEQINEMISFYATALARMDFESEDTSKQLLEQIDAYESRLRTGADKIDKAEQELQAFGPGGLQRDNNEQLNAQLQANLKQWKSEREGYQKHLTKLKQQRADYFKDEKEAQDLQYQKLMDIENEAQRQKEIDKRMAQLKEGPESNVNEFGDIIGFKNVGTSQIAQLMRASAMYKARQLANLKAETPENERTKTDYLEKEKKLLDEIYSLKMDIGYLESGDADADQEAIKNTAIQIDQVRKMRKELEITSNIFKGLGSFFSSIKLNGIDEFGQALSFIGETTDVVIKAVDNFKDKDWISASIATALDVLPLIAKGIGLFPDEAEVRKEQLSFQMMIIDAEIAVQRARLEVRKLMGEEGTKSYYEDLRRIEADEHKKTLAQMEQQMLDQLDKMRGFYDIVQSLFAFGGNTSVNEYGYSTDQKTGKMMNPNAQKIVDAYKKNVQAEEIRYETGKSKTDVDQLVSQNALVARSQAVLLARAKRTGSTLGDSAFGDILTKKPMAALGETPESIRQEYFTAYQGIEDKRKEVKAKYKEDSAEYITAMSELDEQAFAAYETFLNQTKSYEENLRQMSLANEQMKIDSIKGGLDKRLRAQAHAASQEMKSVDDRMEVLEFYNLKESEEYKLLQDKKVLLTQKSADERLEIEKQYQTEVRALRNEIGSAAAAITPDKKDDIDAEFDAQMQSLRDWRDKMRKDFPELKPEINKSFKARKQELQLDRDYKKLQDDESIKGEFRAVLMAEAEATESMLDDIKQEYVSTLEDINSIEKLALANHKLTEDQKTNATRKAVADRLKAEKAMRDKVKNIAIDEFNMLKKIREMQFNAETKDRQDKIRGYKADIDSLDILIRQQELAINRIKQAGEVSKSGLNENDLLRFEQAQVGQNTQEQLRKALLFNDVNLTGNANDAVARATQSEAMDAYAEFLIQKAETDRMLKVITGEQMAGQLRNVALMQASFAQTQIGQVNDYYNTQIGQMQAAGASSEELDIHNRKRDKEIEVLRKKYAEQFERYKELEIQAIDEQVIKDTEAMTEQLENDRLKRESMALTLEEQQIALDKMRLKYEADLQKIDDAITKLELKHLGMDSTFKELSKTMETSVTAAINKVIDRYKALTQAAKDAAAAGVSGVGGTSTGSVSLSLPKIANTGQSSSTMSAKGYYATDGDYWYATDSDMVKAQKYGLKDGAVMPDRPWLRGKDAIGPFMLDEGEEVVKRSDRMSIMDYISKMPDRVSQIAGLTNNQNSSQLNITNHLSNRADVDHLMQRLEQWHQGKQMRGVNAYGYLSR